MPNVDLVYPLSLPPSVAEAYRTAERIGFGRHGGHSSSTPGVGALLAALAAARPGGRLAELGSGVGAASAWLAWGMREDATLITAELDHECAELTRALLAADPRVTVLEGSWEELLPHRGPFDLVFVDCLDSAAIPGAWDRLVPMVRLGGQLIFDDVTPEVEWPVEWRGHPDPKREAVLRDSRMIGAEVYPPDVSGRVGAFTSGALVATRIR